MSWEKHEWVTRLWTLSEGQGNKKCEVQKRVKKGDRILGFGKWTWDKVLNEWNDRGYNEFSREMELNQGIYG